MITQDAGYRRGAEVKLKEAVDQALPQCPTVKNVLVYRRTGSEVKMEPGRDHWWHELMETASADCPAEPLDSEHPLYLLYTSGTTGKPKGILHTTGGYSVGTYITSKWVFDLREEDTFWCTADIGWVTGHSYVVYGPLQNGATTLMYEGAPDLPGAGSLLANHREVSGQHFLHRAHCHPRLHAAGRTMAAQTRNEEPAAARQRGRADQSGSLDVVSRSDRPRPLPDRRHLVADRDRRDHDYAAARRHRDQARFGDEAAARNHRRRCHSRRPIGSGRFGRIPGHQAALAIHAAHHLWRSRKRYKQQYWSQIPGMYFAGDGARIDQDGYFWLMGRVDDVLNVAGHRLSTMEIESALVANPMVAEAAVVGRPDDIKGQAVSAFVTLKARAASQ